MPLKAELKALETRLEANRSPEALAIMHRAVRDLCTSRATGRVLRVGDQVPDFVLPNAEEEFDQQDVIRYADSDPDYTTRPEPEETLAALRTLSTARQA